MPWKWKETSDNGSDIQELPKEMHKCLYVLFYLLVTIVEIIK